MTVVYIKWEPQWDIRLRQTTTASLSVSVENHGDLLASANAVVIPSPASTGRRENEDGHVKGCRTPTRSHATATETYIDAAAGVANSKPISLLSCIGKTPIARPKGPLSGSTEKGLQNKKLHSRSTKRRCHREGSS